MSELMAVSSIGSVIAGGISSWAQYQQGQAQQAAYDYKASVDLENMRMDTSTSEAKYSELMGRQRSLYGAAGVDIRSGSPLLVLAHTAAQGAEEFSNIESAGNKQAAIDKYYGQMAAYTGTVGGVSNFLNTLTRTGMTYAGTNKGSFSMTG